MEFKNLHPNHINQVPSSHMCLTATILEIATEEYFNYLYKILLDNMIYTI